MLAPFLALATLAPQPTTPFVIDDLAPRSALDGWCVVMEVLDRFSVAPYALRIEGAHVAERSEWVGEPLAVPAALPPLPDGPRSIDLLNLRITGGGMGEDAACRVRLELALVADDTLGAALLLEHLLAHFEALPGVSIAERPETVPLAEEAGLAVPELELLMDLSGLAPQRRVSDERFFSPGVAVRAIGMREGSRVRGVRFSPRFTSTHDNSVRRGFLLTPARGAPGTVPKQIFHLLARLEATDPELWPTRIELRQPGSAPEPDGAEETASEGAVSDGWHWKLELESRRPFRAPPAPAPPSALDALTVLREVLAGFRADPYGVNVTGFFPDRARGGAGQRAPALSAAGLRQLATAGGYGIEVRSLSIQANPRSGPSDALTLDVDLRCTSEDGVVEATRLFEYLAESLRGQPELASINQPQVAELADGSGVHVDGLRLALRVPARLMPEGEDPQRPATNPLTHIRSTAALDGIAVGSLRIDANERSRSSGALTEYRLMPLDKQASFELRQVLDLLWTLEREEPGYTLSNLQVSPAGRVAPDAPLPGRWVFQATLCTASGR